MYLMFVVCGLGFVVHNFPFIQIFNGRFTLDIAYSHIHAVTGKPVTSLSFCVQVIYTRCQQCPNLDMCVHNNWILVVRTGKIRK